MPAPYLGGFAITSIEWASVRAIEVRFSTTYGAGCCYQLYAGRTLIAWTRSPAERTLTGQLVPTDYPQFLQVLAVDPTQQGTDYGALLPPRPYNRARLAFNANSWPTDAKTIEVAAGTTVGGAVDPANIVARLLFTASGAYQVLTDVMPGSGAWNFEVYGRDNRPTEGNVGDALALTANLLTQPPDVVFQADDSRFAAAVAGGELTVTYELP